MSTSLSLKVKYFGGACHLPYSVLRGIECILGNQGNMMGSVKALGTSFTASFTRDPISCVSDYH